MLNDNIAIKNIFIATICQVLTFSIEVIFPRVVLISWGSEYNGLINTITTAMRYMTLLEAGMGVSTLQALYQSIGKNNNSLTSAIVKTSKIYYKKTSFLYATIIICFSIIYPLCIKTEIKYYTIFIIIFLQGLAGIITFIFKSTYQQLLNAEGKYYVISIITTISTVLTYALKIIAIKKFNSIILMQLFGVFVSAIQSFMFTYYIKKKYTWLDNDAVVNEDILKNRSYYLVQQLTGLIFNSTDAIIISILCGLKEASVFTIYNMVYSALQTVISIIRNSTSFILGQSYYKNKKTFINNYKVYNCFHTTVGFVFTSTSVILIKGFIKLYTEGIYDINYDNYLLAILLSINIILDCSRSASLAGANIADKASDTVWKYVIEAVLNIFLSIILTLIFGINGVILGTIITGVWRTFDSIIYFSKRVLNNKYINNILYIIVNFVLFGIYVYIGKIEIINIVTYTHFLVYGLLFFILIFLSFAIIFIFANKENLKTFIYENFKNENTI